MKEEIMIPLRIVKVSPLCADYGSTPTEAAIGAARKLMEESGFVPTIPLCRGPNIEVHLLGERVAFEALKLRRGENGELEPGEFRMLDADESAPAALAAAGADERRGPAKPLWQRAEQVRRALVFGHTQAAVAEALGYNRQDIGPMQTMATMFDKLPAKLQDDLRRTPDTDEAPVISLSLWAKLNPVLNEFGLTAEVTALIERVMEKHPSTRVLERMIRRFRKDPNSSSVKVDKQVKPLVALRNANKRAGKLIDDLQLIGGYDEEIAILRDIFESVQQRLDEAEDADADRKLIKIDAKLEKDRRKRDELEAIRKQPKAKGPKVGAKEVSED